MRPSLLQMVCVKPPGSEKAMGLSDERVIGLHLTGPSAGEVMQGFAVALR